MASMNDKARAPGGVQARNTRWALEFLRVAAAGEAKEIMARLAAADFVHHNPYFPQGADALASSCEQDARAHPGKLFDIQRTIAEGDLVVVHSRLRRAEQADLAAVHIFSFDGEGRLRELWDVAQEVPTSSPNRDGMF